MCVCVVDVSKDTRIMMYNIVTEEVDAIEQVQSDIEVERVR